MKRHLGWILGLLLALGGFSSARADSADDQYYNIFNLIQQADALSASQPAEALAKYLEAETALQRFQKGNPDSNARIVAFRLKYLANRIIAVTPQAATAEAGGTRPATGPAGAGPATQPAPVDWQNQLNALRQQARQLQADKTMLEAKLKEALTIQPATVDAREVTRAEEKVKALLKENDLLKVAVEKEKSRAAAPSEVASLQLARQELAEANRQLADQTAKADALAKEKKALQIKLDNLPQTSWNAANIEKTRKELQEANRQLAQQKDLAGRLAAEKETLQGRLKALTSETDALAAIRAENELLKKQLADLHSGAPPKAKGREINRQLAQAQAQIAALQSDKELLRLEKLALEGRVKQLTTSAVAAAPAPAPTVAAPAPAAPLAQNDASVKRIQQLEKERDDLQRKLDDAHKQFAARKPANPSARVQQLETQLATVQARLEAAEAKPLPYTAEELALFKSPERKIAAETATPLPAGTAKLAAEAQRYFAAKELDKAESTYLQVLHGDQKNVRALADLAAIQLERKHFDAAEMNIKQALALKPDDAYSLSILGSLRFRQGKFDESLDALSRAAKLDPNSAEIQNYLGLALSEKGLRGPAESAMRKAIQLQPDYASAHNNLAVIYLTQKPPLTELARYHYQKALAAGHERNVDLEKLLESKP